MFKQHKSPSDAKKFEGASYLQKYLVCNSQISEYDRTCVRWKGNYM